MYACDLTCFIKRILIDWYTVVTRSTSQLLQIKQPPSKASYIKQLSCRRETARHSASYYKCYLKLLNTKQLVQSPITSIIHFTFHNKFPSWFCFDTEWPKQTFVQVRIWWIQSFNSKGKIVSFVRFPPPLLHVPVYCAHALIVKQFHCK